MTVTAAMIGIALGRTGPPTDAETAQWDMWIADAVMLIEARALALEIDPADIPEAKLDYVVRQAVVGHVRRPDAATQVTVSIQDASTSKTYRSGSGQIEFLDEWWVLLGLTSSATGAFSIDTAYGAGFHAAVCSLNFGATYCSCGADLTNYAYPLFGADSPDPIFPFVAGGP